MKVGKLGTVVLASIAAGIAAFLFGTDRGKRVRQQLAASAANLPEAAKDLAALIDTDEVIGILTENALSELKPAIFDLFKGKKS